MGGRLWPQVVNSIASAKRRIVATVNPSTRRLRDGSENIHQRSGRESRPVPVRGLQGLLGPLVPSNYPHNSKEHRLVTRYGVVAQALHWVTAMLVLIAFIYGPGGSEQSVYASDRDFDRQLHETLGLCVLALVAMRMLWQSRFGADGPRAPRPERRLTAFRKLPQPFNADLSLPGIFSGKGSIDRTLAAQSRVRARPPADGCRD